MKKLLILMIILILISGCGLQTFKEPEEFVLTENNFDLVSISHSSLTTGIATTIETVCSRYKDYINDGADYGYNEEEWKDIIKQRFIVTYKLDVPEGVGLKSEGLDCYLLVDGIKYYGKIGNVGLQREVESSFFCDNPLGHKGKPCYYARVDISKSTDITLCCEGICKTKTLLAYCIV